MVFPVNSIVFLVCTWLNIALVIGLGYLVVKFLVSGISNLEGLRCAVLFCYGFAGTGR